MGYRLTTEAFDAVLKKLAENYAIFAPKCFEAGGHFSDTNLIRYGEIASAQEIVFNAKSALSFKEALLPITQVLFYFTEQQVKEADAPPKGALVFLRSCDLHAVKRLDDMYLHNGPADYYYQRMRSKLRFALIGCKKPFENCFCVDMGTNKADNYDFSIDQAEDGYLLDCRNGEWQNLFASAASQTLDVSPAHVSDTPTRVNLPAELSAAVACSTIWDEYDSRCINCGRCNFVCPTCTCYTMQDVFYTDNGRAGERRRVWASCMVDGFTDMAGGACYRQKNGQRMRYKVLHKVLNHNKKFGRHMCVGCGRCSDVCPEYISFSHILNKLDEAMAEVTQNAAQ